MFAARHRFHGHNALKVVYQKGRTIRGPQLSLKYNASTRRKIYRVAVVVSRKVNKSAVVRNRIRRRLYEAIRAQAAEIPANYDLVFTVFAEQFADMPAGELQSIIADILQRMNKESDQTTPASHGIVKPRENQD